MTGKLKVKVIKKGEARPQKPAPAEKTIHRNSAREMVSTVTEWVADFKERKSDETKAAIKTFLTAHPRPNET